MSKPKKRDAAYWRGRLERDFPALAEAVARGDMSVNRACIEVGLIRQPTRVAALKRAWERATAAEKREFVAWVKGDRKPKKATAADLLDHDGLLKPKIVAKLEHHMNSRHLRRGQVSEAMGLKRLDPRLGMALARRTTAKPSPDFLSRLADWMHREGLNP